MVRNDQGEITAVKYFNPKDSADQWAVQTMKVKDGVMVLPTETEAQAGELSRRIQQITGGKRTISLAEFDDVLKTTHNFYTEQGLTPDIYNSNTTKFAHEGQNFGGHRTVDGDAGIYARDSGVQQAVVVEGKPGEELAFQGNSEISENVDTQYGSGKIVLVKDKDGDWRKLDFDYAKQNLRNPDGSAIDWENVPKVNAADVAGKGKTPALAPASPATAEVTPTDPVTTPVTDTALVAEGAEGSSILGTAAKFAPLLVAVPTVMEAGMGGYDAYKKGEGAGKIAEATGVGALHGVEDTFVPGARTGFADVVGHKDLKWYDRALNAIDHASAATTAVGATAMAGEAISVVGLPAEIPTAAITGIAGIVNIADNVVKATLKATGVSGKDQDGGYIYNGGKWAINGVEHLFSHEETKEQKLGEWSDKYKHLEQTLKTGTAEQKQQAENDYKGYLTEIHGKGYISDDEFNKQMSNFTAMQQVSKTGITPTNNVQHDAKYHHDSHDVVAHTASNGTPNKAAALGG